jgi:hypothetical protein
MGAKIRKAFASLVNFYGDVTLPHRVTQRVLHIFRTIENPVLGQKSVVQGFVGELEELQFNEETSLESMFRSPLEIGLDEQGLSIAVPANTTQALFKSRNKAKTAVLQICVGNFSLSGSEDEVIAIKDLTISLFNANFNGAKLKVPLTFKDDQMVLVALGLHFFNDRHSLINQMNNKAAAIVYAAKLKDGVEVIFELPAAPNAVIKSQTGLEWEII